MEVEQQAVVIQESILPRIMTRIGKKRILKIDYTQVGLTHPAGTLIRIYRGGHMYPLGTTQEETEQNREIAIENYAIEKAQAEARYVAEKQVSVYALKKKALRSSRRDASDASDSSDSSDTEESDAERFRTLCTYYENEIKNLRQHILSLCEKYGEEIPAYLW